MLSKERDNVEMFKEKGLWDGASSSSFSSLYVFSTGGNEVHHRGKRCDITASDEACSAP